jgi:hypothetical protein
MRDSPYALALCPAVGTDGLGQDDGLPARVPGHGGRLGASRRRNRHRPALLQCGRPLCELAYDDARNAMVLSQAAQLAISLFEHGWQTVIIFGNSLSDPDDTAPVLARLCPVAEVYHVTLAPALQAVLARCGPDLPGRGPSRLAADAETHARKRHPGSARLDNSDMTPEQTLAELARLVRTGVGRLSCPS